MGEFTIDVKIEDASDAAAPATSAKKAPRTESDNSQVATSAGAIASVASHKTFAPPSTYKNINEFVRPTKGTLVEVLVAWRERVISAYHFSERGTITVGTHPTCEVVVPVIST